jgi:hypothetical protein
MFELNSCPKCKSIKFLQAKLILIGAQIDPNLEEKVGDWRKDRLNVSDCKTEVLKQKPLEQFIDGFYGNKCDLGFVGDRLLKAKLFNSHSG